MRAWLFQDSRQKEKLGDKAPWSVGWIDPEGKRRSKKVGSKSMAEKLRRKREGELAAGLYQGHKDHLWADFRERYEQDILSTKAPGTRTETITSLNSFQRIVAPKRMSAINTMAVDRYIAKRSMEPSLRRPGKLVSPATINKELRHLKAVFRKAAKWDYLAKAPDVEMLREPERIPDFVSPGDFQLLYEACDAMVRPKGQLYAPAAWWRALLAFAYLTGWRVGEILSLRREDLDVERRVAKTRAENNKGRRDGVVDLHPVIVEHIKEIAGFHPLVFPWPHHERTLWADFARLKEAAGVSFNGAFHRLRFAFATMNRDAFSLKVLQSLMRHRSDQTTRKYINVEDDVQRTADRLFVPDVLRRPATG